MLYATERVDGRVLWAAPLRKRPTPSPSAAHRFLFSVLTVVRVRPVRPPCSGMLSRSSTAARLEATHSRFYPTIGAAIAAVGSLWSPTRSTRLSPCSTFSLPFLEASTPPLDLLGLVAAEVEDMRVAEITVHAGLRP